MAKSTGNKPASKLAVETIKHDEATRKNIPTAEYQSLVQKSDQVALKVRYPRNTDLDPQLVWRGKDEQDWSDLVVNAPPLYIQDKVHPKVLIDDLLRRTEAGEQQQSGAMDDMFADFNGLPDENAKTEFYQHDAHWANRMILGDSLQVMASLAEREGLRGKVQCIYFDPPYGIKFNSNFQWSTTSRDVKDGNAGHITREPEQVKAFRDTWRDGIHSYLTYLRDRLTVARDLLTDTASIFVQIGDENVHRVRSLLEEVFGEDNFVVEIAVQKTGSLAGAFIQSNFDRVLWFAKSKADAERKFRPLLRPRDLKGEGGSGYTKIATSPVDTRPLSKEERADPSLIKDMNSVWRSYPLTSDGFRPTTTVDFQFQGGTFHPGKLAHWKVTVAGLDRVSRAGRVVIDGRQISLRRFFGDDPTVSLGGSWTDVGGASDKVYVVQTNEKVIQRCILMATDPGDLVLDPTCGSGTTARVAEQWGRRWITIDTSRVALALARARIMGARYPFYLLADSREGQIKEAEITRTVPSSQPTRGNIRHGFVYERVPHITLGSIARNTEIDVIWDQWQAKLEPLRKQLNAELKKDWQEWEIPREAPSEKDKLQWSDVALKLHADWWQARIARQQELDASIAAKAEFECLYDKPYSDKKKVRVAGPFTVESLSPHRVLAVDEHDELIDGIGKTRGEYSEERDFVQMILQNLKAAGVQQAHKENKINFTSLTPWPGDLVCAEGRYMEGDAERRAAIFIGPEFGTVSRPDLVSAAREAGDSDFDVLITCAFNYDAQSTEFGKLGRIPVLKARMNADLHMAEDLKNTGKGNLFVIFGEPDIDIIPTDDGKVKVKVNGVDVFHPNTGEVHSDGADGIACWFIDTDYNEESFFVRHAYFLGANDPYKALKSTLKAEINREAWESLNSDTSRPFDKPKNGRIAVKVINHLGDEVMKVYRVI
ncbi:site-specific DNA-methyltransferase [Pseudomonas alliivorans]|nr:site-specific DNA-methyltransferase [Pseudomonas alliivorans]MEE4724410.1 site-specific DNA-methyltransferase [Pseudomonas alliivorans]MEE4760465.1 site-specific DNA-methyltransferase [Pseudomonas alliivorans]MEE4765482.1 site-specific DNA-methyltransferase [Pseudomonas alliivorans]MEE4775655.1 site-specific DNA-methyltransferase [Pseudomonas alliivorans]